MSGGGTRKAAGREGCRPRTKEKRCPAIKSKRLCSRWRQRVRGLLKHGKVWNGVRLGGNKRRIHFLTVSALGEVRLDFKAEVGCTGIPAAFPPAMASRAD